MQKSEVKILIVDDDEALGSALRELFSREGYSATAVLRPDDALAFVKLQEVHAILVDCMLPKMNGRDLVKKLRPDAGTALIYLMSGIFRDKAFIREALADTKAAAFFVKPLDLPTLLKTVESSFVDKLDAPRAAFHDVLSRPQLSRKERVFAVNDSDAMDGLDLPWVYSLLMHPRISGHLNIVTADGAVIGVGFQRGEIVQVSQNDTQTSFGMLLVEQGFISMADLASVAIDSAEKPRRIGERLIDANLLSPHAIKAIMAVQQSIRLSKTIASTSIKTNFIESDDLREDARLDRAAYNELIHEWISSKYPLDWLKAFYMPWLRHNLVKAQEWSESHRVFTLPLLGGAPEFSRQAISGRALEELIDAATDENLFYRRLHLLVLARIVAFGDATHSVADYNMISRRLTKLNKALQEQNYFERLGVSQKAKPLEIKRSYHEMAKILHPDKLNIATPEDVRALARAAFTKVSEAYSTLSDTTEREKYMRVLEQGNSEKVLEAEALSESAKAFLTTGDASKALPILMDAAKLAPPTSDLRLHLLWARLKMPGKERDTETVLYAQETLAGIPPEDRHTAIYLFVKGLYVKAMNDAPLALRLFENAASVDPQFIAAKREINHVKLMDKGAKNSDLFRGDLRDVVGMLFKKKK